MTERTDYGKPGDPSGCYFPKEWRTRAAARPADKPVGTKSEGRSAPPPDTTTSSGEGT
jgi:hypothetical protein